MIGIRVIPPPDDPLAHFLERLPQALRRALERSLEHALATARRRMEPGGGGPRIRSGRLARSLRARVHQRGDRLVGELSSDLPYAGVQEYGAVIQARKARYLKFRVQGRWVQARRVVIPARPYLRPALEEAQRVLEDYLFQALEEEMP